MNKIFYFSRFSFAFSLAILCIGLFAFANAAFPGNAVELPKEQRQKLEQAIMGNDLGYIKKMVKKDPTAVRNIYSAETLLIKAVIYSQTDIVRYLLEQGADPNQVDIFKTTPMDRVAYNGNIAIATLLLKHGAHVDSGRVSGKGKMDTPYMIAAKENKVEMCKFLIENGADGSFVTNAGVNALLVAVWDSNFQIAADADFLRFLVEKGSDPNVLVNRRSQYAATPLLCVAKAKRQDLYDFLISVGADPNFEDYYGHTPADYMSGKAEPKK